MRTANCLRSDHLETFGDLLANYPNPKDLLSIRNFSTRSIPEIEALYQQWHERVAVDSSEIPSYSAGASYLQLALNGGSPLCHELILNYYLIHLRFLPICSEWVRVCFPNVESLVVLFGKSIEAYSAICSSAPTEVVQSIYKANREFQGYFDEVFQLKPLELYRLYFKTFYRSFKTTNTCKAL